ncbi:MAG: ketopantoate reductase family protein [Candidatus Parcubacteria bacterium]|nr:ketopantoate reductase family protein [Burkholderiales bacterium]
MSASASMDITIYGAGAIGGCFGAYMVKAGEDVLLVDRMAEHVDAINASGLRISGFDNLNVPAKACLPGALRGPLGVVFLAVKSQDTAGALDELAPLVGPDTVIVSLQNGVNPPLIAQRLGAERTVGTFISFPADWQGPGHVEHGGAGNIWVGELDGRISPRLKRIAELLSHSVTPHITGNIYGYLWAKQIDSSLLFAQAATNETMADLYSNPVYQPLLIALLGEGLLVAAAAGIHLEVFDDFDLRLMRPKTPAETNAATEALNRFAAFWRPRVKKRSGPWRDLAVRKRPTEVEYMVGWLVTEGKRLGVPAPLNERLVGMIHEIERGKRAQGLHNLDELERARLAA